MLRKEFRLRPIMAEDLGKVLGWRNSERIRANMYSDDIITMDEHKAWFERLMQQDTAKFLIFEVQGQSVGLVYFTDIDAKNSTSYWGFYLGEENLPRGCGTVLGVLGLEYAFTQIGIRKLCGEAFLFNEASLRFHSRLGFLEEGRFAKHVLKGGVYEDVVSFALFKEQWMGQREALEKLAFEEKLS